MSQRPSILIQMTQLGLQYCHSMQTEQITTFRREVVDPNAATWERERRVPLEAIRAAAEIGLTGLQVPTEFGGQGLAYRDKLAMIDILSRTSMAFAFSLVNTHNVAVHIASAGTDDHRERFLPDLLAGKRLGSSALTEPGAGSDFASISTTATKVDGGWRLNGEKAWITNAAVSDVLICYAQTKPGSGGAGIASFLVDGTAAGFERSAPFDLYGGNAIGTGGFILNDYLASDEDLFAPAGEAFAYALGSINGARTYVAAMCCSMVRASLGLAVEYGAQRTTFGVPLLDHQGLAWSLASVANQLEAAQLLTDKAAELIDSGENKAAMLPAAHAKKFATEMAEPSISACIQAMGAEGLRDIHPLGRHLAAARIANYVDGSTEIQNERIARTLIQTYQAP